MLSEVRGSLATRGRSRNIPTKFAPAIPRQGVLPGSCPRSPLNWRSRADPPRGRPDGVSVARRRAGRQDPTRRLIREGSNGRTALSSQCSAFKPKDIPRRYADFPPQGGIFTRGSNRRSLLRHFRGSRLSAHSQYRMTVNPADLSSRFTLRSRILLRVSLAFQYLTLLLGICPHRGQLCQKHPSTKRAIFTDRKTKSGLPGTPGGRIRQPLIAN